MRRKMFDSKSAQQGVMISTLWGEWAVSFHYRSALLSRRDRAAHALITSSGAITLMTGLFFMLIGEAFEAALLLFSGVALIAYALLRHDRDHYDRPKDFTIGVDRRADYSLIHPDVPLPLFPIVQACAGGYRLLVTARMQVECTHQQKTFSTAQLLTDESTLLVDSFNEIYALPLIIDAEYRLSFGNSVLLVRAIDPARKATGRMLGHVDWSAAWCTSSSITSPAALFALMLALPADGESLALDQAHVSAQINQAAITLHLNAANIDDNNYQTPYFIASLSDDLFHRAALPESNVVFGPQLLIAASTDAQPALHYAGP